MEPMKRYRFLLKLLYKPVRLFFRLVYGYTPQVRPVEGPCLIVSNHVTTLDPVMLALSFPDTPISFVSSEHLFRKGLLSKLLKWFLSPISRKKAASAADTVMAIIRSVRQGITVGLFAEGECTWDGQTGWVFPATAKLARTCGATLVTYRLEGGHLTSPRWGKGIRKGKMTGHIVGVYPPQELKAMKPDAIYELINRDIREDAWERQLAEPVVYKSKAPAEHMETLTYLCPECGRVGTLHSKGAYIRCDCGFSRKFTETGAFEPAEPFPNPGAWDAWQKERLAALEPDENGLLFSDSDILLHEVLPGHKTVFVGKGELRQYADELVCCGERFAMPEIENMAIFTAKVIVFSCGERYFEITSKKVYNARKYLDYHALYLQRAEEKVGEGSSL